MTCSFAVVPSLVTSPQKIVVTDSRFVSLVPPDPPTTGLPPVSVVVEINYEFRAANSTTFGLTFLSDNLGPQNQMYIEKQGVDYFVKSSTSDSFVLYTNVKQNIQQSERLPFFAFGFGNVIGLPLTIVEIKSTLGLEETRIFLQKSILQDTRLLLFRYENSFLLTADIVSMPSLVTFRFEFQK